MSLTRTPSRPALHPLHAILLAFPIALFTGAVLSDVTYLNSAEMQWSNFSAWLITFALVFGGPVVLWALIDLIRAGNRGPARLYLVLVAVMWVLGLVNAFKHSQDAWSSVGAPGLILSILCAALALVAGWIAYSPVTAVEAAR
ncbi:hypothetical protein M9980_08735 [Sphingomonas donggukensis]|uniref:DUF2231 domain-containing protein n=1 Tax=Sphingomonas donggukensis TaxID=2949093 RepID=A0ABY4TQZ4_9SPHN|nr:DUF2231 domain-containing protein [Sphingomonas donggukensis]URW74662.1 hypothetical protein M9980_08735 [Sphingomonas donggukensis]